MASVLARENRCTLAGRQVQQYRCFESSVGHTAEKLACPPGLAAGTGLGPAAVRYLFGPTPKPTDQAHSLGIAEFVPQTTDDLCKRHAVCVDSAAGSCSVNGALQQHILFLLTY